MLLEFGAGAQAGQPCQQGEVGLAAAAEGGRLGGLETAAGDLEGLLGLVGFEQQQQPPHLLAAGDLQGGNHMGPGARKGRQIGLIGGATRAVAQEVGAGAQQLGTGLENLGREALFWRAIQPQLQGAEHGLGVAGRADPQQSEVIDRQVQRVWVAGDRL